MKGPGRPATSLPYQFVEKFQARVNATMAEHRGMPSNPEHRAAIIQALLCRIQARDPNLAEHCRRHIALIARLEAYSFPPLGIPKEQIQKAYRDIAQGKVSRLTHDPHALWQQRGALIDYLTQEGYPAAMNNLLTRTRWIQQRWDKIINICAPIPCFCERYDTEYAALAQTAKKAPKKARKDMLDFRTPSDIALLLVAHLHTLSPAQARKLLKTPR